MHRFAVLLSAAILVGPEREESFRSIQQLQHRLWTVVVRHPLHHEDLTRARDALGEQQMRGDRRAGQREIGHGLRP